MFSREELANTTRALGMDAVRKARFSHPDVPMDMVDITEVLWHDFLKYNPQNPSWTDRNCFVPPNGHGSMLIYSLLYLTGYDPPMKELKSLRQLHSKTPGHSEVGYVAGVETTTGSLGQGIVNATGMVIAEKTLTAQFNRPGHDIIDHYTYVFMGGGCMMGGISHEVCSLADTLKLGKSIASYDDSDISTDGHIEGQFIDDIAMRFEAYSWCAIRDIGGHNAASIRCVVEEARAVTDKLSLLAYEIIIGFGSPNKAGTYDPHGVLLGNAEVILTREQLGWKYAPLEIPSEIHAQWDAKEAGQAREFARNEKPAAYAKAYPRETAEFTRCMRDEMPSGFDAETKESTTKLQVSSAKIANRKVSQDTIRAFDPLLPELLGGSVDLMPSNLALWSGSKATNGDAVGNYTYYDVHEFGMTTIANGISLHGGFLSYTSTSLMFVECTRSAVRMAVLTKQRQVTVYTHDSIGLGEDSPTHQPVEQIAPLRVAPNMSIRRSRGQTESAVAWKCGVGRQDGLTALIPSRQDLAQQEQTEEQLVNIAHGGYVSENCANQSGLIFVATGSEVELAITAHEELTTEGVGTRVVPMLSVDAFGKQDAAHRESVLPEAVAARVAVEAGIVDYWYKYAGLNGAIVGMITLDESVLVELLLEGFGFTADSVAAKAKELLQ